jgi:ribosomal protein L35
MPKMKTKKAALKRFQVREVVLLKELTQLKDIF